MMVYVNVYGWNKENRTLLVGGLFASVIGVVNGYGAVGGGVVLF